MAGYTKRTWTVENTWNCDTCDNKNYGRNMKCSKCGSPKEKREAYDTSGNLSAPAVTDSKLLEMANAGKNWSCEYCKNDVRNLHGECVTCGGPKTREANNKPAKSFEKILKKSSETKVVDSVTGKTKATYTSYEMPTFKETYKKVTSTFDEQRKIQDRNILGLKLLVVGVVLFLFIWFLVWAFTPTTRHTEVTSTDWRRIAHLEQRSTHHGEGWSYNEPASHFNDSCQTRQDGTEDCHPHDCHPHSVSYDCNCHSVSDGESCSTSCRDNGNGFSSCSETCYPRSHTECSTCSRTEYDTCYDQCPVYHQWCTYSYYNWNEIDSSTTHGHNDHNIVNPSDLVARENNIGPQRILIEERYSVVFTDLNEMDENHPNRHATFGYTPGNAQDFNRFVTGTNWRIETNHAGNVKPCAVEPGNH